MCTGVTPPNAHTLHTPLPPASADRRHHTPRRATTRHPRHGAAPPLLVRLARPLLLLLSQPQHSSSAAELASRGHCVIVCYWCYSKKGAITPITVLFHLQLTVIDNPASVKLRQASVKKCPSLLNPSLATRKPGCSRLFAQTCMTGLHCITCR